MLSSQGPAYIGLETSLRMIGLIETFSETTAGMRSETEQAEGKRDLNVEKVV